MRTFLIDIENFLIGLKEALKEIKSFSDIFEILEEANSIKEILIEILNDGIKQMQEDKEIDKNEADEILKNFLMLMEETIQFDLNKLSSQVFSLETLLFKKKN